MSLKPAAVILLLLGVSAFAQAIPKGFTIPDTTLSPNRRYGVTVPILDNAPAGKVPKNSVVDVKSGDVIAVIDGETGWDRQNHEEVQPARWSEDGSLLLWQIEGKWAPVTLVLMKFEGGKLLWQLDVLKAGQEAILERTKKAAPKKYAAAKVANKGNGSAYPDGFTITVSAEDPIALPLRIKAFLTANPKELEDFPDLDSHMDATIDAEGKFVVKGFKMGTTN